MDIGTDTRIVMTMDAGGTNVAFSALAEGRALVEPISLPSHGDDLEKCLRNIIEGFTNIQERLSSPPAAISFGFPGPADYRSGIIGDLPNMPAFRGGVPLGPMLEERFGVPVFINNDGDLFVYGEAISGLLPKTNSALKASGSSRRFHNLFGVTIGTGFGAGLVSRERLYLGDNGAGMEIWSTRSNSYEGCIAEDGVCARGLRRVYGQEAGIPLSETPEPRRISAISEGALPGNQEAASRAFSELGWALGECLADTVCMTDSLVVVGGGISLAHRHFLDAAVARMNGDLQTLDGRDVRRMEVRAYNLENPEQRHTFLDQSPQMIQVPETDRTVPFYSDKSIGVGVSVLGTNQAVALGAYAYALQALSGQSQD